MEEKNVPYVAIRMQLTCLQNVPKHRRAEKNFRTVQTSYRVGQSGDRIPVEARFSAPVQTGPEAHPASRTMGTGSYQRVKRPGSGFYHPPLSSAKVKERVELYLYSPSGPSWPVPG